jgi:NAD(P)-dependent dehydrogenase (short-subunit alcohol dehydrogenase family)
MAERILLVGASRGIGAAVARHLAARGTDILAVSRSPAVAGRWCAADIGTEEGLAAVCAAVGQGPLDGLLYLGGIWEDGAFTDAYDFPASTADETRRVIAVNMTAPIELVRRLSGNLAQSPNPRVIAIGALSGLPGRTTPEVANSAAKAGLIAAFAAMRQALRPRGIAFTVINPGNLATDEVLDDIAEGRFGAQVPIPMADLLAAVDAVLAMSAATEIEDLSLAQRHPG